MSGAEAVLDQLVDVGAAVWRASWQASVLAVLVVAVQLVFGNRISARWRHAMWMLVLVRLALPVVPSSPVSVFNLAPGKAPATHAEPEVDRAMVAWTTNLAVKAGAPLAASRIEPSYVAKPQAAGPVASRDLWAGWPQVLATVWAMGAVLLGLRIGWATWRVSRTLRKLHLVDDAAVHDVLRATAAELRVRRLPLLLAGDGLFSPALVGFVRPKLLVPRDLLETFDPAELRLIFLHELAHLKRRDVAINWAATVLTVLHWLNPIAWLVVWRLRLERELACDELVMSRTSDTDRRAYGHTIVKLLETFSRTGGAAARPLPAGGVGILEGKAQMKRRITMIAQFARNSRAWTAVAVVLVLALALVALTDAVQAEEPVKATQPTSREVISTQDHPQVDAEVPEIRKLMERETIPSSGEVRVAVEAGIKRAIDRRTVRDAQGRVVNQAELDELTHTETDRLVELLRSKLYGPKEFATPSPTDAEIAQSDPTLRKYLKQLSDLQSERARTGQSVGEKHPSVVALDNQIKTTRQMITSLGDQYRQHWARPTKLKAGDLVTVSIMDLVGQGVETVKTSRIDGDGTISLPYTGAVKAAGLSPRELETAVAKAYLDKGVIQNAVVAVSMPERGESHQMARVRGTVPEVRTVEAATPMPGGGFEDPAMMGMAAPVPAAEPQWDDVTKAMMGRQLPELKLDAVPFSDVVDALRDLTSANIFVNWRGLEDAGIDRSVPVTMKLRDVALKDVLSLVLRNVGGGATYKVENGVIVIDVPKQPARSAKVVTKAYEVDRLLVGRTTDERRKGISDLQQVIMTNAKPKIPADGSFAISAFDDRLIVTTSGDVHQHIEQLLKLLERDGAGAGGLPTTKRSGSETGF